jgi:hypothetical protein
MGLATLPEHRKGSASAAYDAYISASSTPILLKLGKNVLSLLKYSYVKSGAQIRTWECVMCGQVWRCPFATLLQLMPHL